MNSELRLSRRRRIKSFRDKSQHPWMTRTICCANFKLTHFTLYCQFNNIWCRLSWSIAGNVSILFSQAQGSTPSIATILVRQSTNFFQELTSLWTLKTFFLSLLFAFRWKRLGNFARPDWLRNNFWITSTEISSMITSFHSSFNSFSLFVI